MKKVFIPLIALYALTSFVACEPTENSTEVGDRPDKEVVITESELHAKLDNAGAAFINSVDPDDFDDIIYSLYEFEELAYEADLESEMENYFDNIHYLTKSVANVLNARSYPALMKAKTDFEVYTVSIVEALGSNGLVISYSRNHGWTVEESNDYSITVDYGDIIKLSYSKEMTEIRYDDEYYEESYIISVPKNIDFEVIINGNKTLALNVKPEVDRNLEWAEPSVELAVKDIKMSAYAVARDDKAGVNYTYSKGGRTLLSVKGNFNADGLTDIDKWMVEDLEEVCMDSRISAEVEVKIMDIGVTAVADFSKFLNQYADFMDKFGYEEDYDKSECTKLAKIVNDNCKVYLVDLEENAVIADAKMAVASERFDGEMYYYVEPVIELADGETISIMSYFMDGEFEMMFGETIDALDDFIRTIENMFD